MCMKACNNLLRNESRIKSVESEVWMKYLCTAWRYFLSQSRILLVYIVVVHLCSGQSRVMCDSPRIYWAIFNLTDLHRLLKSHKVVLMPLNSRVFQALHYLCSMSRGHSELCVYASWLSLCFINIGYHGNELCPLKFSLCTIVCVRWWN